VKHNLKVISILVVLFLVAQVLGLVITEHYSDKEKLPLGIERPQVEDKSTSFIPIILFLLIATVVGLFILKYELRRVWQVWFFLSVALALVISLSVFMSETLAIIAALVLAFLKISKRNAVVHNFTEVFIYGGLAAIFVPILNITSVVVLLILISIYDYIAVMKTKHMIKLAKFESHNVAFAGLMIPHKNGVAILGGGDVGIPLLFTAVVMNGLGIGLLSWKALIIPLFTAFALALLFLKGDSKKFYPAMPFISLGCFLGFLLLIFI